MSRPGRRGPPVPPSGPRVVVAVPFEGGVAFAADSASPLVKTPWGLLAAVGTSAGGDPASALLGRARTRFRRLPPLTVPGVWAELLGLSGSGTETLGPRAPAEVDGPSPDGGPTWVFSHEVDPLSAHASGPTDSPVGETPTPGREWLGSPVAVYSSGPAEPVRALWGAVVVRSSEGLGGSDLQRGADLYLQGGLDRGVELATRLRLAQSTVVWVVRNASGAWGADGEPPRDLEVVVGIHEAGHAYSVDRIGLRGLVPLAE